MYTTVVRTQVGNFYISGNENFVTNTYFEGEGYDNIVLNSCPLLCKAKEELIEYFRGERKEFTIPIMQEGTPYRLKVWQELLNIPYGETRTYKEVAIATGNEKASRAVGNANNKNTISIIVPCHRVIGANNKMVGYAGGIYRKEFLLKLEKDNM